MKMQHNIFECVDDTTRLLLSNFKQKEFNKKIFVKIKNQSITARTTDQLINDSECLSKKIYYNPTYFPLISRDDIRTGTAWKDWQYPNFDTCFDYKNNKIIIDTVHKNKISIDQYIQKLEKILDNNISEIFKNNKNLKLFLCYSRGIDSILILSYLIKKKLQDKVILINFSNLISSKKNNTFDLEKKLGFKVETIKLGLDELIAACNTGEHEIAICYTTYTLLNLYKNCAFIFGFHGNQSLLHKKIFLEQINKDVSKKGYCSSLNDWKTTKNPTPLEEHCLLIKPWHKLDGMNGCKIFTPLGNEEIFEMVRSIAWSDVDPHLVGDAKVARQIINDNVGNLLDSVILEEDTSESDNIIGDLEIPMEKLDKELFNIQEKNCHDKEGYNWLLLEYGRAKEKSSIKLNTLLSYMIMKKYY
jgi:hypothetical protein